MNIQEQIAAVKELSYHQKTKRQCNSLADAADTLEKLNAERSELITYAQQLLVHEDEIKLKTDDAWHAFQIFKDAVARVLGAALEQT